MDDASINNTLAVYEHEDDPTRQVVLVLPPGENPAHVIYTAGQSDDQAARQIFNLVATYMASADQLDRMISIVQ